MPIVIAAVQAGSIADELGIRPGDELLQISDEPVIDQIDYLALTASPDFDILLRTPAGRERLIRVRKQDWEPLGITLDQSVVSAPRSCANQCVFCFIDQMPPGMRSTLYVKDDDWRLSLMMGNYITMTNMPDREFERLLRRRVSPLYISVHATDPELRCRLLQNKRGAQLMDRLEKLKDNDLRFHCQIVLCPGWNDGPALQRTLDDLASLRPAACSVALVPVGLTRFRDGLTPLRTYDQAAASKLIDQAEKLQSVYLQRFGTRFVFPADEFYCLSGCPLPPDEAYEDYPQIENGVGMLRLFETDVRLALKEFPCPARSSIKRVVACGTSVAPFFRNLLKEIMPPAARPEIVPVLNRFFGESVTVTGLITGRDLADQLSSVQCDEILICRNMIRSEGDLFLDDMSVTDVQKLLPAPLRIVENTGEAFWRAVCGLEE